MSGYLEVKYPSKSSLGLNPFKSWKRQWCILRPSGTSTGGSLAVYCSEAGAAAGSVAIPAGGIVRRTKSRSRPHAFAVFPADDRKPCVLLAAHTHQDAQAWMEKIRSLIKGDKDLLGSGSVKDTYSVTIVPTELSRKCSLHADGTASVTPNGLLITKAQKLGAVLEWRHVSGVKFDPADKMCTISVDSEFRLGPGEIKLSTPLANELCAALRDAPKRARSHTDLSKDNEETSRSSWSSEPSEVSLDDIDLLSKERNSSACDGGLLSRCVGAGDLAQKILARHSSSFDDSMTDRRSLLSIASGIYEEIPDVPDESLYCKMGVHTTVIGGPTSTLGGAPIMDRVVEPTYESVAECVYATMRRGKRYLPPPLPPRAPFGTMKPGESWNSQMNQSPDTCHDKLSGVTRHSSLTSIPRSCSVSSGSSDPQPKRQAFSVFRKRLKSDSRIATSMKSDTSKENKDTDTKKKKFDFPPTKDFLKNFKVGRKMKSLKITGSLIKSETKSCEFLDENREHVKTNRCSKSVECLEVEDEFLDEFEGDLSIEFNDDAVAALALPQEIVDIILRGREQASKIRLNEPDYMPMSPIVPSMVQVTVTPAIEHHYTVMSPKAKIA